MSTFVDKVSLVDDLLTGAAVGHAFGGAIALAYAVAAPRATVDIDVNISAPLSDAGRVLRALSAYIDSGSADVERAMSDGQVRVRWRDDRTPVDLFFPQHAFHEVVAAGVRKVPFAGREIAIISPTHLAVFKVLFNRGKDWVDVEEMLRAGSVDSDEVSGWLDTLVGGGDPLSQRFAELVVTAGEGPAAGTEMERPSVDWRSLGS